MDIRRAPKVDLHVHLEGSIRPGTVVELARRHSVPLPRSLAAGRWQFADFDDFMDQYSVACKALHEPEDFYRIAVEFVEDLSADNVRSAEVVFTPTGHARRLGDWDWPLQSVLAGLRDAGERNRIRTQVILEHSREQPPDLAIKVAQLAAKYAGNGVVALGLGGDERHEPGQFRDAFAIARAAGLPTVAHAGEFTGPESIWLALDELGASRIGHGLSAIQDPRLLDRLRTDGVTIELCPSSNLRTHVVGSIDDHPLPNLLTADVQIVIGSDDPPMFSTTLSRELELVRDTWSIPPPVMVGLMRYAVNASFAGAEVRQALLRDISSWFQAEATVPATTLGSDRQEGRSSDKGRLRPRPTDVGDDVQERK